MTLFTMELLCLYNKPLIAFSYHQHNINTFNEIIVLLLCITQQYLKKTHSNQSILFSHWVCISCSVYRLKTSLQRTIVSIYPFYGPSNLFLSPLSRNQCYQLFIVHSFFRLQTWSHKQMSTYTSYCHWHTSYCHWHTSYCHCWYTSYCHWHTSYCHCKYLIRHVNTFKIENIMLWRNSKVIHKLQIIMLW